MWISNGKPKRGSNQPGLYLLICLLSIQVLAGDGKVDLTVPISRARARDIGIQIGIYQPGAYNAITDVSGVKVGHVTLNEGNSIRTGVTAVIPRDNIWKNRLFGASYTIHGNGETTGMARINQAGWIESPIMLTNTLSVGAVHDGVVRHTIKHYPDNHVILPIVAEWKGDFNLIEERLVNRNKFNEMIYTGAQVMSRKIFNNIDIKHFSMNKIWNELIAKNLLVGFESNQEFLHINSKEIYQRLIKQKFTY